MHDLAIFLARSATSPSPNLWFFLVLTVIFALSGRALRGVTTGGALAGGAICFALLSTAGAAGFFLLLTVFAVTWVCTRLGHARKLRLGTAETGAGRDALQVLANLGAAGGCALVFTLVWPDWRLLVAMVASLAEAAADTVSSEIGQAFGGSPRLVTNWDKVAAGTNGAITLAGTLAGVAGAITVSLVGVLAGLLTWRSLPVCASAGVAGMLGDSFLGATVERPGLLGNNGVNFISTEIAALSALLLLKLL